MDNQVFNGKWHAFKGRIRRRWGAFRKNDLMRIQGNGEEIYGILLKHYGQSKIEMQSSIKDFLKLATLKQLRRISLKGRLLMIRSIRAKPLNALLLATTTGFILGYMSKNR